MSSRHITLSFEHLSCNGGDDVTIDVRVPLPDPITEGAHVLAKRYQPACPICKQPMQYVGFHLGDDKELCRPLPGPGIP